MELTTYLFIVVFAVLLVVAFVAILRLHRERQKNDHTPVSCPALRKQ